MIRKRSKKNIKLPILIVLIVLIGIVCSVGLINIINYSNISKIREIENNKNNTIIATPKPNYKPTTQPIELVEDNEHLQDNNSEIEQVSSKKIVVLDAGHGKSSGSMSVEEKENSGFVQNNGAWGEWRHFKSGSANEECRGSGCNQNHSCWYPICNGDRSTEPDINLQNVLSAAKYLEDYGYEVRLTRCTNDENPSFTKRVSRCYPEDDNTQEPDASVYVCIHSNAGGGRGSAYITCGSNYDQKWIEGNYASESNRLGQIINSHIVNQTSLSSCGNGSIGGEGYLILFNKCPVPVAYMEIGFFDNSSDLSIIKSEHDAIGKAIADGIHEYLGD